MNELMKPDWLGGLKYAGQASAVILKKQKQGIIRTSFVPGEKKKI